MKNTQYVVSTATECGCNLYFISLDEVGCPTRWISRQNEAPRVSRDEAISLANRLGHYLTAYGEATGKQAAIEDAKRLCIRPASGGHAIRYRYKI